MVRIKLLRLIRGAGIYGDEGDILELPDEVAGALISAGVAVPDKAQEQERAVAPPKAETADAPVVVKRRRGRPRKEQTDG